MSSILLKNLENKEKEEYLEWLKTFDIPYRDSLALPNDVTFGAEIEFSTNKYMKYRQHIKIFDRKHFIKALLEEMNYDFSWEYGPESGGLIEIVSDVLTDTIGDWNKLSGVLTALEENGAYIPQSSGAHVHVGKQILGENKRTWINFLKLWGTFEKTITKFTNGEFHFERSVFVSESDYCFNNLKTLIDKINNEKFDEEIGILSRKSCSINFPYTFIKTMFKVPINNSFDVRNTIEVRSPNGTINKVIWQNNINFICKAMLSCASCDFDSELLDYYYNLKCNNKNIIFDNFEFVVSDLVFNEWLDKAYFLKQFYKDFDTPIRNQGNVKAKKFWE